MFGVGVSVNVNQERISLPEISPPTHPTSKMRTLMSTLNQMRGEAPDPVKVEALARSQLAEYGENSPSFNWGSDVHCHGAGVQATTNKVYRLITTTSARTPQHHYNQTGRWPYVEMNGSKTGTVRTGETTHRDGTGRMRGWNGWDDTKDCIESVLASFEHNFEALLVSFLPTGRSYRAPHRGGSQILLRVL